MLKIDNVNINFGSKHILHGSFEAKAGCITGIIGESGSGKTSLLNILSLYYYDQDMDYYFNDLNFKSLSRDELAIYMKQDFAYLPQHPEFLETLTCLENLQLICEIAGLNKSKDEIKQLLKQFNLLNKANQYPKKLSGGQKQRLMLVAAILKEAKVILCDEITSSLDATNTHNVLDILKDLSHTQQKIIILSSHEDDVIKACDVIYEIDNKEIKLKKEVKQESNLASSKTRKTSKQYLLRIALSRLRKKKIVFSLLLLIVALTISSITYATLWTNHNQEYIRIQLEGADTNELMVLHHTFKYSYDYYRDIELPMPLETVESLSKLENVAHVYPYLEIHLPYPRIGIMENILEWHENGNLIQTNRLIPDAFESFELTFVPYYPEQHFSKKASLTTSNLDGIYISEEIMNTLGIEIKDNMTLTFDFFVPLYMTYQETLVWYGFGDNSTEKVYEDSAWKYNSDPYRITLPISGVIPSHYQGIGETSGSPIYIPYELFEKYTTIASENYTYEENQYPIEYNAYKVFLTSSSKRKQVSVQIEELDANIDVVDNFEDYVALQKTLENQSKFFQTSTLLVYLIAIILLLVYGIIHKKDANQDDVYFNLNGITKKEKKWITLIESLIILLLLLVLSYPMIIYLLENGIGDFVLYHTKMIQVQPLTLFLLQFFFSLICTLSCESSLLLKKER